MPYSDLFKPSHLKELCAKYGFTPSKSFGQNYLISERSIAVMLVAAEVGEEDTIIEIGPGFGILTLAAAAKAKRVIAFEIEQSLRPYWEEQQSEHANIEIVWGNALEQIRAYPLPKNGYKILANLPYQITSHAIRTILELDPLPTVAIIMVQAEVADRICARPGTKRQNATSDEVGLLSMAVQYYGTPEFITKVSHGSFWPSPKVDSALIALRNLQPHLQPQAAHFFALLRAGYAHRRKQLWHNLAGGLALSPEKVKAALRTAVGNDRARAEDLNVEQWKMLATLLQ